jgi:16S rRNA (uracil1498-N3)-methyltransferase
MLRYKRKTRIFFPNSITLNSQINLEENNFNHIVNVLRCKVGENIGIFNNINGEFRAVIIAINKKNLTLEVLEQVRQPTIYQYDLHLAYVPLKKDSTDFLIEKAVELGVNSITQIISSRCVNNPLDVEKIHTKTTNATQQCERLDIPNIFAPIKLKDFIIQYQNKAHIFWLNEFFIGSTLSDTLKNNNLIHKHIIFLIGPEGGFSQEEAEFLSQYTTPVYFNSNILKAETASIASILNFNIINCNF